ncbi:flagellar hook-associated protein FlgK [Paenibacillus azoreducens]|uniref:Flagellar hook-associated protein 1 n=1 Tax=Paenibacillus azoreducens TaxID=116718 RepID=A0A920CTX3_9BACL|nr:flagellar hook-associated protein FlgK [Paenibacillus azoreducens]GIO48898.1 flagellar hook-associated protein 1 [Paenibacillus azoreducens]
MTSTFHSIETAKRSLFTQTAALNTTGHNIANANTEGYSRQTVRMRPSLPIEAFGMNRSNAPGQLGTGVEFSAIERIREKFLDGQFRGENSSNGSWTVKYNTLDKLQAIINEPSDTGIRTVLDKFWKAWSDLSKNPEDPTGRKIVVQTAQALTDGLNHVSRQINNLDRDLNASVDLKAQEINGYLSSISDLNQSIARIESLGDNANDLRDQRDLLTDKLSKIINISVTETEQGYNISLGANQLLLEAGQPPAVNVDGEFLSTAFDSNSLTDGEVYGMIYSSRNYITNYRNQLDQLANTIATGETEVTIPQGSRLPAGTVLSENAEITLNGNVSMLPAGQAMPEGAVLNKDAKMIVKGLNGLHQLGYTIDGTVNPGKPFFVGEASAGTIQLNPEIAANPSLVATSLRVDGLGTDAHVVTGNNSLAILLANLKDNIFVPTQNGQKGTIGSLFNSMVGQLGVEAQDALRQMDNSETLVEQVNNQRQSVSGVSLDEEMSNMIMFQHAYGASARFMTTFDQLLDKLINSTGVVGR